MTTHVVLPFPGHEPLASRLARRLTPLISPVVGNPESWSKPRRAVGGREVVVIRAVRNTREELLPVLLTSRRLRRLGAKAVFLVAPRLELPEGSAGAVREVLRRHFDGIVTVAGDEESVDPGPWTVAAAAPALLALLVERVRRPFLVVAGDVYPWMEKVALRLEAPILGPARFMATVDSGGRGSLEGRSPVLLTETVGDARIVGPLARELRRRGTPSPLLVTVHADFTPQTATELSAAGVKEVLSTNTLLHPSNRVDVGDAIADALERLWNQSPRSVRVNRNQLTSMRKKEPPWTSFSTTPSS